jgi:predicted AlkP superfamily pyrophosphatase or phosphodiesterase
MDGTILPFITRTDTPIADPRFRSEEVSRPARAPRHHPRPARAHLAGAIPTSRTSMAQPWWTERRSFENLDGMLRQLRAFARSPGRAYAYAYWPFYDSHCHEHGPVGRIPALHLAEIDAFLARAQKALAGTDTLLLVTADHGHMQTHTPSTSRPSPASTTPWPPSPPATPAWSSASSARRA